MEKILKDLTDYHLIDPEEYLFDKIKVDCMKLLKYKPLFKNDNDCEDYEVKIHDMIYILILRCKLFLMDYYYEKIDSLHSEENKTTAEAKEIVKTMEAKKIVKAVETVKTEETEES